MPLSGGSRHRAGLKIAFTAEVVHGQGMSVAAKEASLLFDLLGRFNSDLLSTLAHDFLTKAENLIADPWAISALPDFIYPETTGAR